MILLFQGFSFLHNFLTSVSKFNIKFFLQAARGGGKINLQGLYSGLAGNLAGVLP